MLRGQLQYRLHARVTGGNGGSLLRGVIAVTSPSPGDGRTGVALGLVRAVAATQSDALLIETDVRHPSLARELGIETDEDLSGLLDSRGDASRIVTPLTQLPGVGAVVAPRVDNMRALEQLNMDMPDILGRARGLADCVIVDAPPLSLASDALPTLSAADQVVLVVRLGHTEREAVLAAAEVLAQRRVILAGIVVVDSPLVEEVEPPGPATRIGTRRTPESTRR
jgi:Mrp family chromosome partitioning ATPase